MTEENGSNQDGLIIKTNNEGHLLWKKTIGGPCLDAIYTLLETQSKNIITTDTKDSGTEGSYDGWMSCLDKESTLIWENQFRKGSSVIAAMALTGDINIAISGSSYID